MRNRWRRKDKPRKGKEPRRSLRAPALTKWTWISERFLPFSEEEDEGVKRKVQGKRGRSFFFWKRFGRGRDEGSIFQQDIFWVTGELLYSF
ncbi:hypothetical protein AVEN_95525-1 [Araneus ventricosus]|uniref:Uncharacterized protein n=1 Tax=Araneus ventricosus TaxID=182803 RepID=A0A4Y2C430_ARAVE|nr:hypothetical protein AVEN_95525-1 [Araneus ventricosus]